MGKNIFFEKKGPFLINNLYNKSKIKKIKIFDIKIL